MDRDKVMENEKIQEEDTEFGKYGRGKENREGRGEIEEGRQRASFYYVLTATTTYLLLSGGL